MVQEMTELQAGLPLDGVSDAGLESALARLDARLAVVQKSLATAQRQLKQAADASRQGNLRDLPRLLDAVAESADTFAQTALAARRSWTFDGQRHLEDGSYSAELMAAAEAGDLPGVREVDGQLYSFPVVVKVDARDQSVKVGRKTQRGVRPSAVVALLKRLRSQPAKDNLRPLLTAFERAYLAATGGQDGVAIPLRRVYELLVLRPGQGREYTEVDFLLDVYRLDRTGVQVTAAGRELSLPASTGTKGGKGTRFVTETGEERLYSSIRFDPEGT
ncbi:MAG TPA: hypothetical protein VOB72_11410 [Candidatus Dormibacteraeota bacterium]|nr:hypothetical protein [Candidatus Dormibacteraeota bacterium]